MSGVDFNEVESSLLASFNGSNICVFDALYVVLGHREGFRVILAKGGVIGTINYTIDLMRTKSRNGGQLQTTVGPTILILKRQAPGCFDGMWDILINPKR